MSSNDHILEITPEMEKRILSRRASDVSTREKAQRYDALVEQLKWSAAYHRERWEKAKAFVAKPDIEINHGVYSAKLQEWSVADAVMHELHQHLHFFVDSAILCPCPHCEGCRERAAAVCERTGGLL